MSLSGKRVPQIGECPDYAGMICRRYYPGDSACQQFGGKQRCLLDLREAKIQEEADGGDWMDHVYNRGW